MNEVLKLHMTKLIIMVLNIVEMIALETHFTLLLWLAYGWYKLEC